MTAPTPSCSSTPKNAKNGDRGNDNIVATISGAELKVDKDVLGKALGRMASGVYIVTTNDGTAPQGILATWVCQAGFEPPILTVALNKDRPIVEALKKDSTFTVNILSKANMDIFKSFAAPAKEGLDRFAGLTIKDDALAGPVFTNAIAFIDCKVEEVVELADHLLVVGTAFGGGPLDIDAEPMVHLRKNGFQY